MNRLGSHNRVLVCSFACVASALSVAGPSAASPLPSGPDTTHFTLSATPATQVGRPFSGVRFYYVASQKRYRAVKFSPRNGGFPAGHSAGAFSSSKGGDSCFTGQKAGNRYVGRLYSIPTGPVYRRTYTMRDLLFGRPTYAAPAWFKKRARQYLNGNGSCAVW